MSMGLESKQTEQLQNISQVIDSMTRRLYALQESADHNAVFQQVYLLMTKEMQRRLESDFFQDPVWVERVLVNFAAIYFRATDSYKTGQPCAPAWDLAFRLAEEKQGFVLQDALLGINAHINSDLPIALYNILHDDHTWPNAKMMLFRRLDHERINLVLSDLVDLIQDELAQHHARFLRSLDHLMSRKDESLSAFILAHCRTNVWYNTELLLDTPDGEQWHSVRRRIERDAYEIGLQFIHSRSFRVLKSFAPLARRNRWF